LAGARFKAASYYDVSALAIVLDVVDNYPMNRPSAGYESERG
jgi:hypothetical protein